MLFYYLLFLTVGEIQRRITRKRPARTRTHEVFHFNGSIKLKKQEASAQSGEA